LTETDETKRWTEKFKEVKRNEKGMKIRIVAANNHYGGYGPGTVDIFRQNMDLEKLSFENVDIEKINRELEQENRFRFKAKNKGKQKTLTDFIK
jgi:hypothetical protein